MCSSSHELFTITIDYLDFGRCLRQHWLDYEEEQELQQLAEGDFAYCLVDDLANSLAHYLVNSLVNH